MLIFNGTWEWQRWASVKSCFPPFHFTLRQIKIDRTEIPTDWTGLRLEIRDVTRSRGDKSGRDKGFILCQPGCMSDLLKAPFGMKKDIWLYKTQPHISVKFFYLGFDGRDDKWHTPGCTSSEDNCHNIRVMHLHPAGLGQYSDYSNVVRAVAKIICCLLYQWLQQKSINSPSTWKVAWFFRFVQ